MSENKKIDLKNNNTITYKGEVTIKQEKNKKTTKTIAKKHNKGERGLFVFILKALAGQNGLNTYRPSYIKAFDDDEHEIFINPIYSVTQPKVDDNAYTIEFRFNIPYTYIDPEYKTIYSLKLFSNSNDIDNELCASMDLSDNPLTLGTDNNIIIYWKLQFKNEEEN